MILNILTAKSADTDGAVWLGSTLFAIQFASYGRIAIWYHHIVEILG